MTIFCFGSINIDHIYLVPRFPLAGETLADTGYRTGLGGKGCNQSLAAAAAGATVKMVGAVGDDGAWAIDHLADAGIDVGRISLVPEATGHAVINVTPEGENQIVIHGGANRAVSEGMIKDTLRDAIAEQWWLCQEETSLVPWSAKMAKDAGLKIAYSAAPFVPEAALEMLPLSDVVAVNAGEAAALAAACGTDIESIPVPMLVVTKGADGVDILERGRLTRIDAFEVDPIDTTGAGDTFFGTFLAGLDKGHSPIQAGHRAAAAAALQVTRPGAAEAIPSSTDVDAFLAERTDRCARF